MADCRFPCGNGQPPKENVCIETDRILDSCRDRDCYENVRVLLTGFGNDIIARTGSVRARYAEIVWASIGVNPIQFNRGFYSVSVRYYVKLILEACVGNGRSQDFDGMAVIDKQVILYGGESNVSIFRSDPDNFGFCALPKPTGCSRNVPTASVEVVDPVVLGIRVLEENDRHCCLCCCTQDDIPTPVAASLSSELRESNGRYLAVSLGIFSVVRLTRPGQFIVSAAEYSVPDKECYEPSENDPCSVFRKMAFPVSEFGVSGLPSSDKPDRHCGCGG